MAVLDLLEEKYRGTTFVERKIGDRVADCGIEYERQRGDQRGVVVEVQFKNVDKDYRDVTKDYLKHGFAVHWVFIVTDTWDHLYEAKDELEVHKEYYLGSIDPPEYKLGERLWVDNFAYIVRDESDIIGDDHKKTKVKIDIDEIDDSINAYLVLERDSIDQSEPELAFVGDLVRDRPAKSIANAKFD